MSLNVLILTDNPSKFDRFLERANDLIVKMVFLSPELNEYQAFYKINKTKLCCVIIDYSSRKYYDFIRKIVSHNPFHFIAVVLIEAVNTDEVIQLSNSGVHYFNKLSTIGDAEFITYLEKVIDNYIQNQVEMRIKTDLDRKLIYEYCKSRGLLESLSFGVLIITHHWNGQQNIIEDANAEFGHLFHINPEAIKEKSILEIKNDPELLNFQKNAFKKNLLSIQNRDITIIELNNDRKRFVKRITDPFRNIENEVIGHICMFLDVTEEVKKGFIDPLTGLLNRRYMQDRLSEEIERVERYGTSICCHISVIMMDIDNFKNINDTYGHQMGDDILQSIGSIFQKISRNVDFVCRYGGEEFMAVLPCTPLDGAVLTAERFRKAVAEYKFPTESQVTISLGVASSEIERDLKFSGIKKEKINSIIQSLVANADIALYKAKNTGKNRVVSFSEN